jgi:hypothetical protein
VKSLFTIHAGEFVLGDIIGRKSRHVNLWVPARDTGIDLLITDSRNQKTVSLQVKSSRDYPPKHLSIALQQSLACGSWTIPRQKLAASRADYWVFVVMGFDRRSPDFVVIKPSELLARLDKIHGKPKRIWSYLWVTEKKRCWETRGLKRAQEREIAHGQYSDDVRDFTRYLNDWSFIEALN